MTNKSMKVLFPSFLLLIMIFFPFIVFCQQPQSLEEGINLYKAEKYEEAIAVFKKARQEKPDSSSAAFYLGMAYKQTMEYEGAQAQLKDAVTLTPKIKEALIELIDVSLKLGDYDGAAKWIGVAEQENIEPANTAFLKGLMLMKQGKNKEAAESFAKAKSLDPKIAQASDIQIAVSQYKGQELKDAKKSLESAITVDPQSDMAGFARQYLAKVEEDISAKRPFHFTASLFGQHDDNVVLKPSDDSLAPGIKDPGSNALNTSFKVMYTPQFNSRWLLNTYYTIASSIHSKYGDSHDSLANTVSVTPGYNLGKYSINLSGTYTYFMVKEQERQSDGSLKDLGYKKYTGKLGIGPMFRWAVKGNQLLEFYAGYDSDKYYEKIFIPEEERTSSGYSAYASWVWLFKKDSFLNVRYRFSNEDAKGSDWDNTSHDLSASVILPVRDNIKLQFGGEYMKEDFSNKHVIFDKKRKDSIYNVSAGASWEFYKDLSLIGQVTRIGNGSNIGIYDYTRDLYTLGLEYRF